MRLFLLPLSTRRALIYCQRITTKPASELSIVDKITQRAADTWTKWESTEKGLQKTITRYGNAALQRISYEEWGLKSFPPLTHRNQAESYAAMGEKRKFDVVYPGNIMKHDDVPKVLARLAKERKDHHWRAFLWCTIIIPFTLPLTVVPVIPNIPFFYLAFRSWSNWRALKGSDHLDFILDHQIINPKSTPEMEAIYRTTAPNRQNSFEFVTASQIEDGYDPEEHMLLNADSHQLIAKKLEVPELGTEVERAVKQLQKKLTEAKTTKREATTKAIESPISQAKEKTHTDR